MLFANSFPVLSSFIIDLTSGLFSSPKSTLIIIAWIVIIVPAMISTVVGYKPIDSLGYLSSVCLWCVCGLLVILSPISLLLYLFYRWLYNRFINYRAIKKTQQDQIAGSIKKTSDRHPRSSVKTTPPLPNPRSFSSTNSVTSHCVSTKPPEYDLCRFIWVDTILFGKKFTQEPSLKSSVCVWTAFFYAITKSIRNQTIVDKIYSQFQASAVPFISNEKSLNKSLSVMQQTYWEFRQELNASDIDPRTESGLSDLWDCVRNYAFLECEIPVDADIVFAKNAKLLIDRALKMYNLKPKQETIYLMETPNGMLVRVPESKLDTWEAAQNGQAPVPTEEQKRMINERIMREIYISPSEDE